MAAEIGFDQIFAATKSMMPRIAAGEQMADLKREMHIDPDGLRRASREAAEEEFTALPEMGPLGRARLRNLSRSQREAVLEALIDTYEVAFVTALLAERARRAQGNESEAS